MASRTTGLMLVPVRGGSGMVSLRCARLETGERVGLAFTSETRLVEVMGADQPWIRLDERAIRALLAPLAVTRIRVDPSLVVAGVPADPPAPDRNEKAPVHGGR